MKIIPGWDEGHPGVKLIPGWNNSCKRRLRPCLHELFHHGMSFIPGWLLSLPGVTFTSVSGHLPVSVYMIWSKNRFAPGWFHPGLQHRNEIIPGRTHFCTKSCKHSQVNDQTPRWKSPREEIKVIPGWNNSCRREAWGEFIFSSWIQNKASKITGLKKSVSLEHTYDSRKFWVRYKTRLF